MYAAMSLQAALAERLTPETTQAVQHVTRVTTSTEQHVLLASNTCAFMAADPVVMLV